MGRTLVHTAISISCISMVLASLWHPGWLEQFLPTIVDLSTFGLAALGGYLTLYPPTNDQKALKALYVVSLVLLAGFGIGANKWERSIESSTQSQLQADNRVAEERFSRNLEAVKQSNTDIFTFLRNLPQGISGDQAAELLHKYLAKREAATPISELTNERLNELTKSTIDDLSAQFNRWVVQDGQMRVISHDAITVYNRTHTQPMTLAQEKATRDAAELRVRDYEQSVKADIKDAVLRACDLRDEIFSNRLGTLDRKQLSHEDQEKAVLFAELKSGNYSMPDLHPAIDYLKELQSRLEAHVY
jgi:hypothetical protein